jgi:hypothetical protein
MNNDTDKTDKEILASICYSVEKGDKDVIIDVSLEDYNLECNDAIIKILSVLSQDSFMVQTINMIRDALKSSGREDLFVDLLSKIGTIVLQQKLEPKDDDNDKPCISPIDMM